MMAGSVTHTSTFRSETDKELKSWWLHDDEPNDSWKDPFDPMEK
jgi:hypothetical protein